MLRERMLLNQKNKIDIVLNINNNTFVEINIKETLKRLKKYIKN